jgi:hypothetical protein
MSNRISQSEYARRMAAAKEAYLQEMQAAGADSGKVSLANKKLGWAEEAAKEAFHHRSVLYKFFDSIPIVGKPFAIMLDSVEMGIAEHGLVLGLAKGLLVGGIIAIALIVVAEGVMVGVDVVREGTALTWTSELRSRQRGHAIDENSTLEEQRVFHRGKAVTLQQSVRCSIFDEMKANADSVTGWQGTKFESLQALDPDVLNRNQNTLNPGARIIPFFHYFEASNVYVLHIETPIFKAGHHDVAILADETGAQYAVATMPDDRLVLIPLQAYQAAHLPMHETPYSPGEPE